MKKRIKFKDKVFFIIQGFLKYIAFSSFRRIRSFIYRPFFKKLGYNVDIQDGITFKYPSDIEIGNNVKIAQNCYVVGLGGLKIGDNVLIGAGSKIVTTIHNFSETSIPMAKQGLSFEPIMIESDVWLGFNVIVLSGSKIKKGAIIGANAVVTRGKELPEFSISVGIPAKVIKYRINDKGHI